MSSRSRDRRDAPGGGGLGGGSGDDGRSWVVASRSRRRRGLGEGHSVDRTPAGTGVGRGGAGVLGVRRLCGRRGHGRRGSPSVDRRRRPDVLLSGRDRSLLLGRGRALDKPRSIGRRGGPLSVGLRRSGGSGGGRGRLPYRVASGLVLPVAIGRVFDLVRVEDVDDARVIWPVCRVRLAAEDVDLVLPRDHRVSGPSGGRGPHVLEHVPPLVCERRQRADGCAGEERTDWIF